MPIFKASGKLIYYAHVPKCAGSAVETYLQQRFGQVAFQNVSYLSLPEPMRWSRTSPQHIDRASLNLLFPEGFFDAVFSIVRHPVSRLVSAYHFQRDVEQTIHAGLGFGEWLEDMQELRRERPFAFDNHTRPMAEIVPEGAHVFYMEHGLDAMVPWLDDITGEKAEPRAVPHVNKKGDFGGSSSGRLEPSESEIATIARLYAADFERFAYVPGERAPTVAGVPLSPEMQRERDDAIKAMNSPITKLRAGLNKVLNPRTH